MAGFFRHLLETDLWRGAEIGPDRTGSPGRRAGNRAVRRAEDEEFPIRSDDGFLSRFSSATHPMAHQRSISKTIAATARSFFRTSRRHAYGDGGALARHGRGARGNMERGMAQESPGGGGSTGQRQGQAEAISNFRPVCFEKVAGEKSHENARGQFCAGLSGAASHRTPVEKRNSGPRQGFAVRPGSAGIALKSCRRVRNSIGGTPTAATGTVALPVKISLLSELEFQERFGECAV